MPYDPVYFKTLPETYGFAGGVNEDGSTAYVGVGNGAACNNEVRAPCALKTTGNAGCNIPCGSQNIYDNAKTVFFLLKNPKLTWVPNTETSSINVLAIKTLGPNNLMFGKANIGGSSVLGKVLNSNGVYTFQAVLSSGAYQLTNGFDVLICSAQDFCGMPTIGKLSFKTK